MQSTQGDHEMTTTPEIVDSSVPENTLAQRKPDKRVDEETVIKLFSLFSQGLSKGEVARALDMPPGTVGHWLAYYDHRESFTDRIARRLLPDAVRMLHDRGYTLGMRYEPDVTQPSRKHVPVKIDAATPTPQAVSSRFPPPFRPAVETRTQLDKAQHMVTIVIEISIRPGEGVTVK